MKRSLLPTFLLAALAFRIVVAAANAVTGQSSPPDEFSFGVLA